MQRAQVEERLAEARVKIGRRQVVAPIDGTVLRLRYHTIGGVVEPADEILEIVPDNDVLVAEARISPNDIDTIEKAQCSGRKCKDESISVFAGPLENKKLT